MNGRLNDRFFDLFDVPFGRHSHRVIDLHCLASSFGHSVNHRGGRGDQTQRELALEPLAHDVHVQQTQKAAAKSEAQRLGGFRFVSKRRIVETELFQSVAQILVLTGVGRIEATENHGLHRLEAGQRLIRGPILRRNRVADPCFRDFFDARHQKADFSRVHLRHFHRPRGKDSKAGDFECVAAEHHADARTLAHRSVKDTHHDYGAMIGIEPTIDNQRPQRPFRVPLRRREPVDDPFENRFRADPFLGAGKNGIRGIQSNDVLNLLLDPFRLRAGQIDLVDDRKNFQVVVQRHMNVGHRLRLDPLGRIDDQ